MIIVFFRYLLTYKLSQDHLELFFSSVRSKGGFNNNPSPKQFAAIFKRLLIHHELTHQNSNCDNEVKTPILSVSSTTQPKENISCGVNEDEFLFNVEYFDISNIELNIVQENITHYIAGFIVKKLSKAIKCHICSSSLSANISNSECPQSVDLIAFKQRGGLHVPSSDLKITCELCEKVCQEFLHSSQDHPHLMTFLISAVVSTIDDTIFVNDHYSHRVPLINKIAELYFKIRIHHANKLFNQKVKGENVRQILSKSILFKNQ